MKTRSIAALMAVAMIAGAVPVSRPASAETALDLHGLSRHADRSRHWQETNLGIGVEHNGWVAGYFRNSYNRDTFYAGAEWLPVKLGAVSLGARAALVTGYRETPVLAAAVAQYQPGRVGATLMFIPAISSKHTSVVSASLRILF